ncbi:MAG: glycoside hydrolase family 71/99-like protein [Verrucomicrobiota bacterium]
MTHRIKKRIRFYRWKNWFLAIGILGMAVSLHAAKRNDQEGLKKMEKLGHYTGISVEGVDRGTLENKMVVGYQGWYNAEGDGAEIGWRHYSFKGAFKPGNTCIDYWPDVSELGEDEKYKTPFQKEDGSPAYVFSDYNQKTVTRHFQWMKDYGIDVAFLQRFGNSVIKDPETFNHCNTVLRNVREAANLTGRAYVVMYDLSGLREDSLEAMKEDWRRLVRMMGITKDPADKAYLHHRGKPLVAVWGIGFSEKTSEQSGKRAFDFLKQKEFVDFLQHDPEVGGCAVMVGIPTAWRTLTRDSIRDPEFHEFLKSVEVISPWTPGRYRTPQQVVEHANKYWREDVEWTKKNGVDYLPVVFPGFSWVNKNPTEKLNDIPRLGGKFLWTQYVELKKLGVKMVYESMFDEMDEGTQIFKTDSHPPVGTSSFCWYGMDEGTPLASDYYLWLVGEAAKMIRGERELSVQMPKRE